MREALKRASHDEKQKYIQILQRKSEISQRLQEICAAQEALNEEDKLNVFPEKPSSSRAPDKGPNRTLGRSSRDPLARGRQETADYVAKRKQYTDALAVYRTKNSAILSERMKLMQEFLELKAESDALGEAEKWLLLSMAIRNQSSLLGFMQVSEVSDEKTE